MLAPLCRRIRRSTWCATRTIGAWEKLQRMEYVMFVEPRQQGKTSLIHHLAARCRQGDYVFAYLDLVRLDTSTRGVGTALLASNSCASLPLSSPITVLNLTSSSSTWFLFLRELAQIASSCKRRRVDRPGRGWRHTWRLGDRFLRGHFSVYVHRSSMECFKDLTFIMAGAQDPREHDTRSVHLRF